MKILVVWDGDYPWDVRVEKVCKTFLDHGDEVVLVSRNAKSRPRRENIDGLDVRRVFAFRGGLSRWNSIITFPFFLSPLWLYEIYKAARQFKPDLMVIRDLPMALGAILVAKLLRIPTAFDMAECYPEMLRCIWKFEDFRMQNLVVRNPYLADIVEKITISNVDRIWVMVEESALRLIRKGVPESRICVVSNTPPLDGLVPRDFVDAQKLTFFYVGLLNPSRGLRTVIEAAGRLKKVHDNFEVVIAGDGKDMEYLQALARNLRVEDCVRFAGWVDHKSLHSLMAGTDVGIVPHYVCSHWDNTIPNKLFDYMKAEIPVLTSNARPAERIVNESQCGLVYINDSADDLAEKMALMFDRDLRERLGRNGGDAFRRRYHWNFDSKVLLGSAAELADVGH